MKKNIYILKSAIGILLVLFTIVSTAQTSPGNVSSDLQLWLRADEGTSLTGTDVDSWTGQSPNNFVGASQGSSDAEYIAEGLNFNPVLRFYGNSFYNLGNPAVLNLFPSSDDMTIITMVVTTGSSTGTVISKAEGNSNIRNYQVWFGTTDRVLHHTLGRAPSRDAVRWGTIFALNEPKITSGVVSNLLPDGVTASNPSNRLTPYVNGFYDPADRNDGVFTGGDSSLDVLVGARRATLNTGSGYRYNGDIAEIIIYDRGLTSFERQKVESYLAIKYGVTLGSNDAYWDTPSNTSSSFGYAGTSNDYIASNGSILWNGTDNAGYGYNIFGIARDDDSNLLQEKSKSVNVIPQPILTMEAETGALSTNLSYLLAGNNSGNVALTTSSLPTRSTNILERIWKARESTNDAGMVTLEFDLSTNLITDAQATNLELFIADNASMNNYKNTAGVYNAATNILTFTGINFEDQEYFTLGSLEEFDNPYHLNFNGSSTYLDLGDNNDLNGSFTISAWINSNSNNKTIVSKGGNNGYRFRLNSSGNLSMTWSNSGTQTVTSNHSVPLNIWHHVAVIYNGSTAKVYIDGVEDGSSTISLNPTNNAFRFYIGANGNSSNTPSDFFSGEIDELRVWNRALLIDQLRFIMNQEIQIHGSIVDGTILPPTISKHETCTIPWTDLLAYYTFSHVRGNCLFNESSNTTQNARLYNVPTSAIQTQTTPLPFVSNANTNWDTSSTWTNGSSQYVPNSTINGTSVDWNIVDINHNISTNRDISLLGLISNANKLKVNGITGSAGSTGGNALTVTHYLKLDGNIDLQGESQLIQTDGSTLDVNSSGTIERDQQGNKNLYSYNYWSSPVGRSNTTSNNNQYQISEVLTDGSLAASPVNINYISNSYNGTSGTPIGIADYWIWKYVNKTSNDYASWQQVRSTGTLEAGEGYTMKGVEGTVAAFNQQQNYAFNGKPNNGDITLTLSASNDYLIGNPYPSAIDAKEFIKDNLSAASGGRAATNVIDGTIYFWDHFAVASHNLADYQGGYATYTLLGGVEATSNDVRINATGVEGTKVPVQYIPVSQGFFVRANDGGTITFKNSQRIFKTEVDDPSLFLKSSNKKSKSNTSKTLDDRSKIKLNFDSPQGYHRKILVGVDESTSNDIDYGYDGLSIDTVKEDLFWVINNQNDKNYIIQAVNNFDTNQKLPLGIKIAKDGLINIKIDKLENITEDTNIYLHDKALDAYTDLRQNNYQTSLATGEYYNRFEITFSNQSQALSNDNTKEKKDIEILYLNDINKIVIENPKLNHIKTVEMVNILGQSLFKFDTDTNNEYLEYDAKQIQTGAYIIKIETEYGKQSKKIIIK